MCNFNYVNIFFSKALKRRPKYIVEISRFLDSNDTGKVKLENTQTKDLQL